MTMIAREVDDVLTVRITGKEDIATFKQAINRAMNVWDGAPWQMKELGDMITEGKLMQDYKKMYGGDKE